MKSVSEELRLGRLSRRLSQADVAAKAGFSTATLCRIEKGEKQPSQDEIHAIAKALGQTVAQSSDAEAESAISKFADTRKRLKIEISLEELSTAFEPDTGIDAKALAGRSLSQLVLYVDLDQSETSVSQQSDDDFDAQKASPYSSFRQRG